MGTTSAQWLQFVSRVRKTFRIAVVSDVHCAAAEERERCANFNYRQRIENPAARVAGRLFHHVLWLREHGAHNHLLEKFIAAAGQPDLVVGNGDYSCDFARVGVSNAAAFASAEECLGQLRARFGENFRATLGDHELGKVGLFGEHGSMPLASWQRATKGLRIDPFWSVSFGKYILLGITSSLVALPLFKTDLAAEEINGGSNCAKFIWKKSARRLRV